MKIVSKTMRFLVLPDLHMDECHEKEIVNSVESIIQEEEPDHIFSLGDIITQKNSRDDKKNARIVSDIFDKHDIDYSVSIGNNERDSEVLDSILNILSQKNRYGEVNGDIIDFYYIDSTSRSHPFYSIGNEQMDWLREKTSDNSPFIVLSHNPLAEFDFSDNYWFPEHPEKVLPFDSKYAIDELRNFNLKGSITAHIHQPKIIDKKEELHISLDSFHKTYGGDYLTNTYIIIEEKDSKVEIKTKGNTTKNTNYELFFKNP